MQTPYQIAKLGLSGNAPHEGVFLCKPIFSA
jgi:hypothetical protein